MFDRIELVDSNEAVAKKILKALRDKIRPILIDVVEDIDELIINLIVFAIRNSNEVQSMLSGDLKAHLGFAVPDLFVGTLLDAIRNDIKVLFKDSRTSLGGQIVVEIIKGDYSKLLGTTYSSYKSGGYEIEWLRWLLFEGVGTNIISPNYYIEFGSFPRTRSRSGKAVMNFKLGSSYNIPAQYAGTKDDNFITRALSAPGLQQNIKKLIYQSMIEKL